MGFFAFEVKLATQETFAADEDFVMRRFAKNHKVGEFFLVLDEVFDAVEADFFVVGEVEFDAVGEFGKVGGGNCVDDGGDAGFHVAGAESVEFAGFSGELEWVCAPTVYVFYGVGMA